MKLFFILISILTLSLPPTLYAKKTDELLTDAFSQKVLDRASIHLGVTDIVNQPFDSICRVLNRPDLLKRAQKEFARSVSTSGTTYFPVTETTPGTYHYINEHDQQTDLYELYRNKTDPYTYDFIVRAEGKRFFGRYDVIIHLQLVDAGSAGTAYTTRIHIYLHNILTRFYTNHSKKTRQYLKKQTRMLSYVVRQTGIGLCEQSYMEPCRQFPASATIPDVPPAHTEASCSPFF